MSNIYYLSQEIDVMRFHGYIKNVKEKKTKRQKKKLQGFQHFI